MPIWSVSTEISQKALPESRGFEKHSPFLIRLSHVILRRVSGAILEIRIGILEILEYAVCAQK